MRKGSVHALAVLVAVGWSLVALVAVEGATTPDDGELRLVVALFRHGVRAPLKGFAGSARDHSKEDWPGLAQWGAGDWGDLTEHGKLAVTALGRHYASAYKTAWPSGFKVFLWADVDPRTRDTAAALAEGLEEAGVPDVTVASLPDKVDPLFHPFSARCGMPDPDRLARIAEDIETNWPRWATGFRTALRRLEDVLACRDTAGCKLPLEKVTDTARACPTAGECEAPIDWKGRFSYASSASEAFLLEYANGMPPDEVGWGRVPSIPPTKEEWTARTMLRLHEFYFDKTEREPYVAAIQGSNLVKEVLDLIERKVGRTVEGCPHADAKSQFVGLVGHDTNLAGVGSLLKLGWQFGDESLPRDRRLPPDMLHLRHDGALPAGALVFELRHRTGGYFVRVSYLAQSPGQMRELTGEPFRLAARGPDCKGQPRRCEMSLETFRSRARRALIHREFLSRCDADGRQVCAPMGTRAPEPSR